MKSGTVAALNRLNRRFYADRGEEFSDTRGSTWPAWERVLDRFLETRPDRHASHSILDVGCGNGRFATTLRKRLPPGFRYVAVDASPVLVSRARRSSGGSAFVADFVARPLPVIPRAQRFDLIVLFGVLHHVPSWERRRSFLVERAGMLRAGGMLAASFWQFASEERFVRRFVDWRQGAPEVDRKDLEAGDHLVRWGDGKAFRYCHYAGPAEAAELTWASGLRRLETFRCDGSTGAMNLYHPLCHNSVTCP
jgi:tRNA (uracil-5-)-methyltransferase TRM9